MFSITSFIVAIAGGIFGAALGALPSFIFVGALTLLGAAVLMAGGDGTFLNSVAFGAFGPHVGGWAAGVATAAWAARAGKLDSGRNTAAAGMGFNEPKALLVGAGFGALGYLVNFAFGLVGFAWTDTVALTVVVSAIVARLAFGRSGLLGNALPKGKSRFSVPSVDCMWVPWQNAPMQLILLGMGGGLLSAYIALTVGADKGGAVIGFGISAFSLVFAQVGVKVPVTHHITLTAAVAAAASGSLMWGLVFGLVAAFVGEFYSRLWLIYGDTHIDPPACTIATLTTVSLILSAIGVYSFLPLM
jgi:hypothetical protein